jgi:hypothetical protein
MVNDQIWISSTISGYCLLQGLPPHKPSQPRLALVSESRGLTEDAAGPVCLAGPKGCRPGSYGSIEVQLNYSYKVTKARTVFPDTNIRKDGCEETVIVLKRPLIDYFCCSFLSRGQTWTVLPCSAPFGAIRVQVHDYRLRSRLHNFQLLKSRLKR